MTEHIANEQATPLPSQQQEGVYVDRAFTIVATMIGMIIGVAAAAILGGIVLALRQPLIGADGSAQFSLGVLMIPIAAIVSIGSLLLGVFHFPVVFARRREVVLDPDIFPALGAIVIGIFMVVVFIIAMAAGII